MLVVVSFFDAALSSYNTAQFFIVSILLWRNGCYWYLYKRSVFILEWFWGLNCLHRYILKSEIWFEIWLITFGNTNCCQLWRFASVSGDISSGDWTVCWLTFFFFFLTEQVFMKEAERQILQDTLHKEVIRKIILLQSWLRMVLERRRFLRTRQAAIVLQVSLRNVNLFFLKTNNLPHRNNCLPWSTPPSLQKFPFLGLLAFPLC